MWDKRFGGVGDEHLTSIQQVSDSGFILSGSSASGIGGNKTQSCWGYEDYWIVKVNAIGNKLWDSRFGGSSEDYLNYAIETSDKGFLIGGSSKSGISGDKTQSNWDPTLHTWDFWIVKVDSLGNKEWDKRFGGTSDDEALSLLELKDHSYILAGSSNSDISGEKSQPNWDTTNFTVDFWVLKIDSSGNKLWDKRVGGISSDLLSSIQPTSDGGFLLGGSSTSDVGGDKTQSNWDTAGATFDYWIVKIDSSGNKLWDKSYGGFDNDKLSSFYQTPDKGILMAGFSNSTIGGDKTDLGNGGYDYWIVKADSNGAKLWDKSLGGTLDDGDYDTDGWNLCLTNDSGFIVSGSSYSPIGGDKTENNLGSEQTWVIKCDQFGNKVWDKTIFTAGHDENGLVIKTFDNCFLFANYTGSGVAGYKTENSWDSITSAFHDYWIVKFCDTTTSENISQSEFNNLQLLIFPNPAKSSFTIHTNTELKNARLEIFNMLGEKVYSAAFNKKQETINISTFSAGIYLVKMSTEEKQIMQKLLVE